jgi:peptidoglycan/LPS O-acetylase OafA/YrhL
MIVSSIAGYFILLPDALISLSKSIIAGIFFVYNVYLWGTGFQYGEPSLLINPLVNLWTLSVEEQFYISVPILLLLTIKFFKKFTFLILFFLFFSSLIAAEWMSKTDLNFQYIFFGKNFYFFDKFNFYFIYSRIFELILGSFLAYFELNYIRKYNLIKSDPILSKVCPSIGILLIIYSFIFFDKLYSHFLTDILNYGKQKGVLGDVEAYYVPLEAHGRGSLHGHGLLWLFKHD